MRYLVPHIGFNVLVNVVNFEVPILGCLVRVTYLGQG